MAKKPKKLFELVAIEPGIKQTTQTLIGETNAVFAGKKQIFEGFVREFEPAVDGGLKYDPEISHLETSVEAKLKYLMKSITLMINNIYQKEAANCAAFEDIVIETDPDKEDIILAKNVPVQALVRIENLLEQVFQVFMSSPTTDVKKRWAPDDDRGNGFWKTDQIKRIKTKKEVTPIVVVPSTEHHPAQVREVSKDVQEGYWAETHFSGGLSPAHKSQLLTRLSDLIAAVKKARSRANQADVTLDKIAFELVKYVMDES